MYLNGVMDNLDDAAEELTQGILRNIESVEYAGLLLIDLGDGKTENYSRDLTMNTGVFNTSFTKNGCRITEQAFSSYSFEVARWSESEPVYFALQHSSAASSSLRIRQYASFGFLASKHRKTK